MLLCAAAATASAGLHTADERRGPLPELARQYAEAELELEVTSDPRPLHPRNPGPGASTPGTVFEAEVTGVTAATGRAEEIRSPVLVVVRGGDGEARAKAARKAWAGLLPSTRLRLHTRLAPPFAGGDRVVAVVRVPGTAPPPVVSGPSALQRTAGRLRAGLREAAAGLPPDARALLPGLVVGDTSRVPRELHEAFRATELTHLLAVSGSNLTIVLVLLIGPPGTAARAERRGLAPRLGLSLRATALLGGALTLAFVIVCRPDPSVLRAAACGVIVLLAIGTGRRRSLIPALAAAVLLLVLYDPWLARSYGFALSVLATGALLTLAPRWSAGLRRRRVPPRLAEALAAALAAQAACAPVVVVLSDRISLVAVPCNLLAEFAVAPATVLGFAALAAAPVAMPLAEGLAWGASWPTGWIADVARTGAALPGAGVPWPGGWRGGLLLGAVIGLLVLCGGRLLRGPGARVLRHPATVVCGVLLLFLAVLRPAPLTRVLTGWPPPGWRYAVCDVGQGDASVLAAGEGTAVVVDAGPEPALADRCLRALGVTRVPLVVLTHFHIDHVGGLSGVLRGRAVGAIQTTGLDEPPGQAEFVRRQAAARGIPLTRAEAGERRRLGPLSWRVLWPPAGPDAGFVGDGPNDASVTMLVRAGSLTLLLPGDLEPPAQEALLRAEPALGPVDVLKVAHHGSGYQDLEFLLRVRPRLALISAGRGNRYGHPARRTVDLLRHRGTGVLRTDTDGALAVSGAGRGLRTVAQGAEPRGPPAHGSARPRAAHPRAPGRAVGEAARPATVQPGTAG